MAKRPTTAVRDNTTKNRKTKELYSKTFETIDGMLNFRTTSGRIEIEMVDNSPIRIYRTDNPDIAYYRVQDIMENRSRNELIKNIYDRMKIESDKHKAKLDSNKISFDELVFYFQKEDMVCFVDDSGNMRGGIIRDVYIRSTMYGPILFIRMEVAECVDSKYSIDVLSTSIRFFEGYESYKDLNVVKMNDEMLEKMKNRAKIYMEYATKTNYVMHDKDMYVHGFFGMLYPIKANGRCVIDHKSFGKFYSSKTYDDSDLTDSISEQLCLTFPSTVNGYSLSTKRWGYFKIENLSPIEFNDNAFELLILDDERKFIVKSMVREKHDFKDLIAGKDGGLIFLLYGPPGVGKTLTAEAIAEDLKRPLYVASVGELGTNVEELEEKLTAILELCSIWNAVLLIDEADVFLEKRSVDNIERNAMVGIFLRLLEYYSGVLFLTTNRKESIDLAIHSRVSVTLGYEDHDEITRKQIIKSLIGHQNIKMSDDDISSIATHKLNGRQIKNLIKTAMIISKAKKQPFDIEHINMAIKYIKID